MRLSNRLLALLVWGQSEMALSLDGYRLVGVLTGTTDRPGIALIEHDGTHHWVAEHRSLDGWTVDRIEYRRVVLRRDGRRSTIECNLATGAPRDDVDLLVGPELADTLMGASSYPVFGPQGLRGWGSAGSNRTASTRGSASRTTTSSSRSTTGRSTTSRSPASCSGD